MRRTCTSKCGSFGARRNICQRKSGAENDLIRLDGVVFTKTANAALDGGNRYSHACMAACAKQLRSGCCETRTSGFCNFSPGGSSISRR